MTRPGKAILCVLVLLAPSPALAQAAGDQRPPEAPGPTVPQTRPGETLSEGLNRIDGVTPPPRDVDPTMTRTAPPAGTTPILPPPDRMPVPK